MPRFAPKLAVAVLALTAITFAISRLVALSEGLVITPARVGSTPVTVFRRADVVRAPTVVIAHGFAGSQQLMQPFAMTLARSGLVAVTFDFPGHGRSAEALDGGLANTARMQRQLIATLDSIIGHARALEASDGRVGLLGHSMAAEIVARHADGNPGIRATVAVSLFLPHPQALRPDNLLIIDGALEHDMLREQGIATIAQAIGRPAEASVTYGDFRDGSARRIAFSRGVEHIGVLYGVDSMREARDWMNLAFDHRDDGPLDRRGPWLGMLFAGLIVLAWPLSGLVPRLGTESPAPARAWRRLATAAAVPAVLAPLLVWHLPQTLLPVLLADYLWLHFATYGLLTLAAMALVAGRESLPSLPATERRRFAAAALVGSAYGIVVIGGFLDTFVNSYFPDPGRLPWIVAMFGSTLIYFVADEWLTRRFAPVRFGYAITKACFLVSLLIAIALNLESLFFLIIIVPAILLLFCIHGLFSRWLLAGSRQPLLAAVVNAVVFAWFITVTFPLVER